METVAEYRMSTAKRAVSLASEAATVAEEAAEEASHAADNARKAAKLANTAHTHAHEAYWVAVRFATRRAFAVAQEAVKIAGKAQAEADQTPAQQEAG